MIVISEIIENTESDAKIALENNNVPLAIEIYKFLYEKSNFKNTYFLNRCGSLLRKDNRPLEFIKVCREYIKINELNDLYVKNTLCWCIYDEYIKKYDFNDLENFNEFLKEANYICQNTNQLEGEDHFKNPYVFTVLKVIKVYTNKNNVNYNKILEWLYLLDPNKLSEKVFNFQDKDGKEREQASIKEFYYQNKIKALEKINEFEKCIEVCEECFEKIKKFHYKNHIWIESRLLFCQCMVDSNKIEEYTKFAEINNIWHIYSKISNIYYRYNQVDKALIYACKAILCSFEYEKMINLFLNMAQLFENKGQTLNAKKYFHASAYYRKSHLWSIPEELEYAIKKYDLNIEEKVYRSELEEIAKKYVCINEPKKIKYTGKVIKILPEGKSGFIKFDNIEQTIYFNFRDVKSNHNNNLINLGSYLEFQKGENNGKNKAIEISFVKGD